MRGTTGADLRAAMQVLGNSCMQGFQEGWLQEAPSSSSCVCWGQKKVSSSALGKGSLRNLCEPLMFPCSSSKWLTSNTGVGVGVETVRWRRDKWVHIIPHSFVLIPTLRFLEQEAWNYQNKHVIARERRCLSISWLFLDGSLMETFPNISVESGRETLIVSPC